MSGQLSGTAQSKAAFAKYHNRSALTPDAINIWTSPEWTALRKRLLVRSLA